MPFNYRLENAGGLFYQTLQDGGAPVAQEPAINLIAGAGVAIVFTDTPGVSTNVTISAAASLFYTTIETDGVPLTQRANLNIIGGTVADNDPDTDLTLFYQTVQDGGVGVTQEPALNLVAGAGVALVFANTAGVSTDVTISAAASLFYTTIEANGVPLAQRANLNIIGGTVVDNDPDTDLTLFYQTVLDATVGVAQEPALNFTVAGDMVLTFTNTVGVSTNIAVDGSALLALDGDRAMTGDLDFGTNSIVNAANATLSGFLDFSAGAATTGTIRWDDTDTLIGDSGVANKRLLLWDEVADTFFIGQDTGADSIATVDIEVATSITMSMAGTVRFALTTTLLTLTGVQLDMSNDDIIDANTITFEAEFSNGTLTGTPTIDWNDGHKQFGTLGGNVTLSFTNPPGPASGFILRLIQDGTPPRLVTWPAAVEWAGGVAPVLSAGSADVDVISFYFNGTTYFGSFLLDFS